MKTVRFSVVMSLVLLSSTAYIKSNGLYDEGVALGKELCKGNSYSGVSQQDFPQVREIFRTFSTYEPSAHQFKNAYSKFKTICGGIKDTAAQSYSRNASMVQFSANMVIESQNIGQVFIKIGNSIKLLGNMPIDYQVPDNLTITPEGRSDAHAFGKEFSINFLNLVTEYSVPGNHLAALQEYTNNCGSILNYVFFTTDEKNDAFSLLLHIMNGCNEGLREFPLDKKLNNVKPFKATLVRFIHSLLLSTCAIPEVMLKGGRPDYNGYAEVCIRCGKEIEAMS